ncbi:DUF6273 domain-containing protein [Paenibacillus thiaminolyticus]|uniref:DUF6273 domain-containing protein n=1 Tax=Paenibacillus thiaminolyticus TaxID=49283 RepID=UPI003D6DA624
MRYSNNENVLDCCSNYNEAHKNKSSDKVFLLSLLEIIKYLRNRRLDYRASSKEQNTFYWLRDMSTKQENTTNSSHGIVLAAFGYSNGIFNNHHYVRPALYIKQISPVSGMGTLEEPFLLG